MKQFKFSFPTSTDESSSSPPRSADEAAVLLKQPMIETPEKDRRFDPNELMNINLIKTPPGAEDSPRNTHKAFFNDGINMQCTAPSVSSSDLAHLMICHEDYPRLLDLLNQVENIDLARKNRVKRSTEKEAKATAKLMKEQIGMGEVTIYRGQICSIDRILQGYYTMLRNELNKKTIAITTAARKTHPTDNGQLLPTWPEPNSSCILNATISSHRNSFLMTPEIISWADDFLKTSPLIDCKSPAREIELIKRTSIPQKTTTKQMGGKQVEKTKHNEKEDIHAKTVRGKKRKVIHECKIKKNDKFEDTPANTIRGAKEQKTIRGKKRLPEKPSDSYFFENNEPQSTLPDTETGEKSPTIQHSAQAKSKLLNPSNSIEIANNIAIALTPHPFKTNHLRPFEVTMEHNEPLSEITCRGVRSSILLARNTLGLSVAIPRVSCVMNGVRTGSSSNTTILPSSNDHLDMDGNKRNTSSIKEIQYSTAEKSILKTINEAAKPIHGKFCASVKSSESFYSKNTSNGEKCENIESKFDETKAPRIMSVDFIDGL